MTEKDNDENDSNLLNQFKQLLPEVAQEIKKSEHDQMFLKLCHLVSFQEFPADNICFLLFTDLVQLLSTSTSQMRYNNTTVKFW